MGKEQISKPSSKPKTADDTFNGNLTAQPQGVSSHKRPPDFDPNEKNLDYGEASLHDAKISGYTDRRGHAVSMAKDDVEGSPTGAFTDIGAGRSSAVRELSHKKTPPR